MRRGALAFAVLTLVVAFSVAVSTGPGSESGEPAGEASTSSAGDAANEVPEESWATGPIDQAAAVPSHTWQGWAAQPAGRCAWLPESLPALLGATGEPSDSGNACELILAAGEHLRIQWGNADSTITWAPLHHERAITVADLQAREFAFRGFNFPYQGGCQVSVHTRGLSDLTVVAWRPPTQGTIGAPDAGHCDQAHRAAHLVATSRVAAAGGESWPLTPQTPSVTAVEDLEPCELLVSALDEVLPATRTTLGGATTDTQRGCRYRTAHTKVTSALSPGPLPALAMNPDHSKPRQPGAADTWAHSPADAGPTRMSLGMVSAATQPSEQGCIATAELAPDRLLEITYTNPSAGDRACAIASNILTSAIQRLLDHTT